MINLRVNVYLDRAASVGAFGSFHHAGQICMASGRHLVQQGIADEYTATLAAHADGTPVGNPATEHVALGPIIDERQRDRVHSIVTKSVEAGARLAAGGTYEGLFYRPTVLADVPETAPAYAEEIFGPVAPVISFRDDDEAVALANGTEYGLAAAVQSRSPQRAAAVAEQLRAGMVHVNDQTVNEEPPAPFGGFGCSSNGGHFGGVANLELWTEWQWQTARDQASPFPF